MSDINPDNGSVAQREDARPHLVSVTLNAARPWNIVMPRVYRYEDSQHIDAFFASGRLRLSSFAQFAKYPDEHRGDTNEGKAILTGRGKDCTIFMVSQVGVSALVFCCSARLDVELMKRFGRNSAFEVCNTSAFALEISRQLPGFRHGFEGSCWYQDGRIIRREIDLAIDQNTFAQGTFDLSKIPEIQHTIGGPEQLFLKNMTYQYQAEYRILWELDQLREDCIFVEAPLARQYCRRVNI